MLSFYKRDVDHPYSQEELRSFKEAMDHPMGVETCKMPTIKIGQYKIKTFNKAWQVSKDDEVLYRASELIHAIWKVYQLGLHEADTDNLAEWVAFSRRWVKFINHKIRKLGLEIKFNKDTKIAMTNFQGELPKKKRRRKR